TTNAMDYAAMYGHLDVVKWLHEMRSEGCTTEAMDGAAENGHLDAVQWLHGNRSEGCTSNAMIFAAENQFWHVIDWLNSNRSEGATAEGMDWFARHGNMKGILWGQNFGSTMFDARVIAAAVLSGHFKIARFLHHERQWSECDVIPALRECSNSNRRWEFAEWMHVHHRDEFEQLAVDIFADSPEEE
ncbi:hypothetical protein PHMEG_00034726, partial [Phytophthora megakarya]